MTGPLRDFFLGFGFFYAHLLSGAKGINDILSI